MARLSSVLRRTSHFDHAFGLSVNHGKSARTQVGRPRVHADAEWLHLPLKTSVKYLGMQLESKTQIAMYLGKDRARKVCSNLARARLIPHLDTTDPGHGLLPRFIRTGQCGHQAVHGSGLHCHDTRLLGVLVSRLIIACAAWPLHWVLWALSTVLLLMSLNSITVLSPLPASCVRALLLYTACGIIGASRGDAKSVLPRDGFASSRFLGGHGLDAMLLPAMLANRSFCHTSFGKMCWAPGPGINLEMPSAVGGGGLMHRCAHALRGRRWASIVT